MKRISLLITLFLLGCATTYENGITSRQLSENTFQIRFSGNAKNTIQQAADFSLRRASELTLASGYRYFVITQNNSYTDSSSAMINTIGNNSFLVSPKRPKADITIACFNEKPSAPNVYDATYLLSSIKEDS